MSGRDVNGEEDLRAAWISLLESDAAESEAALQEFLERNPCLLPGARTLDTSSGHDPWPHAVISQPKLPGLSDKFPDFMWIAADSAFLYPILIELETPSKVWFQQREVIQHSELTKGINQMRRWKAWFERPRNQVGFYEMYQVPRELQDLKLTPRYVLIHGRRAEANRSQPYRELRAELARSDERLLTFDHLEPDLNATEYFTVSIDEQGYRLKYLPTGIQGSELPEEIIAIVSGLGNELASRGERLPEEGPRGYEFPRPLSREERLQRRRASRTE